MPTYQYLCTECGEALEVQQSFADDALTVCPMCEGRLRKVFNAVGVVFKGSGFYRNDSRATTSSDTSKSEPPANGAKTSASSDGATKKESPKNGSSGNGSSGSGPSTSTTPASTGG